MAETAQIVGLTRGECLRLLGAGVLGRVVFTDAAMPAAQPVTYILDREEIIFRAVRGSTLATATRHAVVGFQADDIDLRTRTGWSVFGVGQAYEVTDPVRLGALTDRPTGPGRDNSGGTVAVPMQQLTGRRLRLSDAGGLIDLPGRAGDGRSGGARPPRPDGDLLVTAGDGDWPGRAGPQACRGLHQPAEVSRPRPRTAVELPLHRRPTPRPDTHHIRHTGNGMEHRRWTTA